MGLRATRHKACYRTPRFLGVDGLALRRRYSYATLLVDLETHQPVDLVEGRDAETLAAWLRDHPGVEVIHAMDLPKATGEAERG